MPPPKKLKRSAGFSVDHSGLLGLTRDMSDIDDFSESRKIIADLRSELAREEANPTLDKTESLPKAILLPHKEPATKLAEDLIAYIGMRGPVTLHDYIAQTSNHRQHGYYQQAAEKIGSGGDFVTSPEISQLFGEMIAVWLIRAWEALGSPKNVNLIELGPGKGTLMKDILRVVHQFPQFKDAISVHMVDVSDVMRTLQREALGCDSTVSKTAEGVTRMTNKDGIPISWYDTFSQVKNTNPILLVAQEFLDVFPVHQFVYTKKGWREKLVDIDKTMESKLHFRQVISSSETPAARILLGEKSTISSVSVGDYKEEDASDLSATKTNDPVAELKFGDEIEISPLALSTIEYISQRVVSSRGAVLLIDYGEHFTQGDSLRAFKKHSQVSVYSEPGNVDITADVDFSLCSRTAKKNGAEVHGSIGQGEFLMRMGIVERAENLIELPHISEETAEEVVTCLTRLVGDAADGLGKRFKVMAITDPLTKVEGFDGSIANNTVEPVE